jgi:hypothetical protein
MATTPIEFAAKVQGYLTVRSIKIIEFSFGKHVDGNKIISMTAVNSKGATINYFVAWGVVKDCDDVWTLADSVANGIVRNFAGLPNPPSTGSPIQD